MTREYLAIGPNCWGRGSSRKAAVKAMRKQWPTYAPSGEYRVYSCPIGSTVDAYGRIVYTAGLAGPFLVSSGSVATRVPAALS